MAELPGWQTDRETRILNNSRPKSIRSDMQVFGGALERYVSAVRELSEHWLPVQTHTTEITLKRFNEGVYHNSRVHLARDLRQDPSLYLYCIKELSQRMPSSDHTPLELFFNAPLEWISEAVRKAPTQSSFDDISDLQAARIKESMVAAVTSELLCPTQTLDPELGYTCSLLRQLGITLAAWNYPREYERAMSRISTTRTLEESLQDALGFCPTALGSTYAKEWRLCREIQDALKVSRDSDSAFVSSERLVRHENPATKIKKICQIGETLARAMQPRIYTTKDKALEQAQVELIRHLGRDAIKTISETTRKRLLYYRSYDLHMPAATNAAQLKKTVVASLQIEQWKKQNSHLSNLDETNKALLEEVYRKMTTEDISRDAIRKLVKEIIPAFGFPSGYVYLYSPKQEQLCANLTIGTPSTLSPKRISLNSVINKNLLSCSAYSLKSALRSEVRLPGNIPGTIFACRIGTNKPVGVLYLETTPESLSKSEADPMTRFKALVACLAAALLAE